MTAALACPTCDAELEQDGPELTCAAGHAWRWDTVSGHVALVALRQLSAGGSRPASAPTSPPARQLSDGGPIGTIAPTSAMLTFGRAAPRRRPVLDRAVLEDRLPARWQRRPSTLERAILAVRIIRQAIDPAEPCPYCPTPVFARRPMAHTRRYHPIGGRR